MDAVATLAVAAEDAGMRDSTHLTEDEVVERVEWLVEQKLATK